MFLCIEDFRYYECLVKVAFRDGSTTATKAPYLSQSLISWQIVVRRDNSSHQVLVTADTDTTFLDQKTLGLRKLDSLASRISWNVIREAV